MITEWIILGVVITAYIITVLHFRRKWKAEGFTWRDDNDQEDNSITCGICGKFHQECINRDCPWKVGPGGQTGGGDLVKEENFMVEKRWETV